MAKTKLLVERETYEKNDKTYYSYFVRGNIRGKDVKALLSPPDNGGYAVLDIVFGDSDKAELKVTPFEIKDEATKRIITGNTYEVEATDASGEIFKCTIKPFRKSDKSILDMLLR